LHNLPLGATMAKVLLILIASMVTLSSNGQLIYRANSNPVYLYELKPAADASMQQYFDSSIASDIACKDVFLFKGKATSRRSCNENILLNARVNYVGFQYRFFSCTLNYEFIFYITVDKNKIIRFKELQDSAIQAQIPDCIRYNKPCSLISKDSAIAIIKRQYIGSYDSIGTWLEKPNKHLTDYYWKITVHPKGQFKYDKYFDIVTENPGYEEKYFVVNATNGSLVSVEECKKLKQP
jgi:hypothetical protein